LSGRQRGGGTNAFRAVLLVAAAVVVGAVVLHSLNSGSTSKASGQAAPPASAQSATTTTVHQSAATTSTTTPLRPPSQVTTLVANGTSTSGAAARVQALLQKAGYDVLSPTNARSPASASNVYYAASFPREATAVAELLGLAPSSVLGMPATPVVANLRGADVVVVVGPDLANQSSGGR
jgi:hypothetical protein